LDDSRSAVEALTDYGMVAHRLSKKQSGSFLRSGGGLYVVQVIETLCSF
jgi:hypothetical protein